MSTQSRDASFDILKGIGIVGVIVLHASNWSSTRLTMPGSNTWAALFVANRVTNIGVPLFLMVSALLLARSLSRSLGTWNVFYRKRLQGLLWPYLVWTGVFWLLKQALSPEQGFWTDFAARGRDLLLGKASYHLYFMSVLLQFVAAFPAFFLLFRRVKMPFLPALMMVTAAQAAVMVLQKHVRFPYPGSIFLWYLVPLGIGVWIGMNWNNWQKLWMRWWPALLFAFAGSAAAFLEISLRQLEKASYTSDQHKWSHTAFTLFGSLLLLGLSMRWREARTWAERLFRELGQYSLQLYLMHVLILSLLASPQALAVLRQLPYSPAWVVVILVTGSYMLGRLLSRLGLDGILFGRPASKAKSPQAA